MVLAVSYRAEMLEKEMKEQETMVCTNIIYHTTLMQKCCMLADPTS